MARYGLPAWRGVARRGAIQAAAAWPESTRLGSVVGGVKQVPSQGKLDPCRSARRGDEPSRRDVGEGLEGGGRLAACGKRRETGGDRLVVM